MVAQDFQTKGAETQKDGVRGRVRDALARLREANGSIPGGQRKEITLKDVEREAPVSIKTLERDYHAPLLRDVHSFLAEINVGVAIEKPKSQPRPRKTSVFKQNNELMQRVETLRYQLRTELAEKQRQIDAKDARIAALTDEIAKLRRQPRGDGAKPPKQDTRRSRAA
ncbi:MAG: hypothetical protein QOI93_5217 [Rhodospirillaceae bacterium]|jgi:hypothetical protein|nr:hypothetical protein [Rhodospirillaceae bacterium]